jgi:hypothetical protein
VRSFYRRVSTADPTKLMRRNLFNSLCALSLLLLIGSAVLFSRSVVRPIVYGDLDLDSEEATCRLTLNGDWELMRCAPLPKTLSFEEGHRLRVLPQRWLGFELEWKSPVIHILGKRDGHTLADYRNALTIIRLPFWIPFALTSILPAIYVWKRWKRRRVRSKIRAGFCGKCGYDLRASTDRCPECGALFLTAV